MRRFQIGVILMILLLILGIGVQLALDALHTPAANALSAAAEKASEGNTEAAHRFAESAERCWRSAWIFTACFADHQPMEDIDCLFAQLPAFSEDGAQYAAVCADLSRKIVAVADAHRLKWWNVL